MARSDLFLFSNYVHLGCEEYMISLLMMANVAGLFIIFTPEQFLRIYMAAKELEHKAETRI